VSLSPASVYKSKGNYIMKVHELLLESPEERIAYTARALGPKLVSAAEKDHFLDREVASDPVKIATMLAEFDPSKNKQALAWITKQYTLGAFKSEDKNKIKSSLELFSKVVNKLQNKDLMSYKDLSSLYDALAPFEKSDGV
jgi:hypothetical protein